MLGKVSWLRLCQARLIQVKEASLGQGKVMLRLVQVTVMLGQVKGQVKVRLSYNMLVKGRYCFDPVAYVRIGQVSFV